MILIGVKRCGCAFSSWFQALRRLLLKALCGAGACSLLLAAGTLRAELQFDVFIGYDGFVRESGWNPLACEVFNDGPAFNADIEITFQSLGSDQVIHVPIELPTNTRKRVVIPIFASGGRFGQWNARLLDSGGNARVERLNLSPRGTLAMEGVLLGALPRGYPGLPAFPEVRKDRPEYQPQAARLQPEFFPDNPIALESLDAIYLNSEKALELRANQIAALLAWIRLGGHLIVSVEQLADINTTPWLKGLLPCDLDHFVTLTLGPEFESWVRQEPGQGRFHSPQASRRGRSVSANPYADILADPDFKESQIPVAAGSLRDGQVVLEANGTPLIVEGQRDRGLVTVLLFNPEREPFRSWKNRPWFWAKAVKIPGAALSASDNFAYGKYSIDGVFGALIDSRQQQNLPIQWLLLLLVVYLLVIGPVDQYVLKKLNRQMLTWITFPTYVVLFSLLIYFIGYKLRAGDTEWNELHLVDVLPKDETSADLRGRTFASIYSSANARYPLSFQPASPEAGDFTHATLRGELLELSSGGREGSRASINQYGNVFRAEIFVPVWTSLLYVNDWFQPGALPVSARIQRGEGRTVVTVNNRLPRTLSGARVVVESLIYELGVLPAGEQTVFTLRPGQGMPLAQFVQNNAREYQRVVDSRRSAFGQKNWLDEPQLHAIVASFPSLLNPIQQQRGFGAPPGHDLAPLAARGDALLFAWDANQSYVNPIYQFRPPRSQRHTLLRMIIPKEGPPGE